MATIVVGAAMAGSLCGGIAFAAYQGHMFQARKALLVARHQLEIAAPDKAGHRIAAIRAVDVALRQVNLGIRAGNR